MIFKKAVHVKGALNAAYSFKNKHAVNTWIKDIFPKLEKKYGKLEYKVSDIDGLSVGDTCYVWGEGDTVFKIQRLIKYSEDRWGFVLDSGWTEEVVKCYKILDFII